MGLAEPVPPNIRLRSRLFNALCASELALAAAVTLLPTLAHAQAIEAWVQRYDGPGNGDDFAYAIAADANGNVVLTGSSQNGANNDYATIKYSSAGVLLWTNFYNGSANGYAEAYAVAVDGGGNVVVTGYSSGSGGTADCATIKYSSDGVPVWTNRYSNSFSLAIALDASSNVFVMAQSSSGGNGVTIKYSSAGALSWARTYSYSGGWPSAMAVDAGGNVFVTGALGLGGPGSDGWLTLKYSNEGELLWAKTYGAGRPYALVADASGNMSVTGRSSSISGLADYLTIKYSSAGVPVWTNRYNGPANDNDEAMAVAVDASGNVVVTGWSWGGSSSDYATIKYSSGGMPLWTNRYNGPGNSGDEVYAIAVDASGNVFVTGSSDGGDYGTLSYSSTGVPLWTNRYNGPGNDRDWAKAVAVDASGGAYVTGSSVGVGSDFDFATVKYVVPPIIARQPVSCTNAIGTTASVTVEAWGAAAALPLNYQWRRSGTNLVDGGNLSGVTTTSLLIAKVQTADAGSYTVVITNTYGSVTSSVAQLNVYVPPSPGRFTRLAYSLETGFSFIFRDATVGKPYRVQTSPSLAEGSWVDWMSFTYNGPTAFTDLGALDAQRHFYRVVSP